MMSYTLGEAARATGKSKTTIQRSIKKGIISGIKGDNGRYSIEPSELHRVYPPVTPDTVAEPSRLDDAQPLSDPTLNARIGVLEALLEREREALEDLRADRDAWKQQATALLGAPEGASRRRWWRWW